MCVRSSLLLQRQLLHAGQQGDRIVVNAWRLFFVPLAETCMYSHGPNSICSLFCDGDAFVREFRSHASLPSVRHKT